MGGVKLHTSLGISLFLLAALATPTEALAVMMSLDTITTQDQTFTDDSNVIMTPVGSAHVLGWNGQLPVSRGGTGVGSFTTGSLLFFNGSTFAQDNSNLFWDDTNNRLGIGTSSPTSPLHVSGTATVTSLTSSGDSTINALTIGLGGGSISTNTAIGNTALLNNTTGVRNVAVGDDALRISNNDNTAVGQSALGGSSNNAFESTAIGSQALQANTTGAVNTGLGFASLQFNTTGDSNTGLGVKALQFNTTGSRNVAFGVGALSNNTTGGSNIALGNSAGRYQSDGSTALTTASNSIYIGDTAIGNDNNDSNSIVLGYNAIGAGANKTVIGNQNMTDVYFGSSSANANIHAKKMFLGNSSIPGCIIMGDVNGGVVYITVVSGVVTASTTQPSACQ